VDRTAFTFLDEIIAPGRGTATHVVDYEVQAILSRGWQQYVAMVREASGDQHAPVVRKITTSFESECKGGERLVLGVRAAHRTRRSFTLEEHLWTADAARTVATSWVVVVTIDRDLGRAVEVSPALLNAIECLEGRRLELEGQAG
jgi:acyl-CoA thioesterase FadM